MTAPIAIGIRDAADAMQSGSLTAVELMMQCLDTADRLAAALNVFAARNDRDQLLVQAAEIDRRRRTGENLGLLAGIPLALKDIYLSRDLPTTASSKVFAGHSTGEDGFAVAKLRAAGALIVGKTQTHEFAYGPTTANEYAGPSRNPWNPEHVPGGSSGGSAIAVATGMCLGATASDTGGSIRHPSAFCGVTGLKPTYGRVSRRGIFSLSWSLDHAGPIARSVDDVAFLLQVMAGYDPQDPGSIDTPVPDYVAGVGNAPEALRVGIPKEHYFDVLDPEVGAAFDGSLKVFEDLGWSIEEVSLPHLRYGLGAELAILSAEATAYHRETMRLRADDVSANVRKELDSGAVVLATDYLLGQRVRRVISEEFAAVLRQVELLATPTIPIPAPRIGQSTVEIGGKSYPALDAIWRNAFQTNLTGSPSLCLPCGFTEAGLPVSLQLIGRNFDELALLQAGAALQAVTEWHQQTPTLPD
jgi:aspartyl-tRNA(Asn)/glutamyl-tRNA(Gln) amidotransferase subunit A